MANLAIAKGGVTAVCFDWNDSNGAKAFPMIAFPGTGGVGGAKIDRDVYVVVVAPPNNASGQGLVVGMPLVE